jgi:tetratricopeptide (TPR) repeat protein
MPCRHSISILLGIILWAGSVHSGRAGRELRPGEVVEAKPILPKLRRTSPGLKPLDPAPVRKAPPNATPVPSTAPLTDPPSLFPTEPETSAAPASIAGGDPFNTPVLSLGDTGPSVDDLIALSSGIAKPPQLAPPPVASAPSSPTTEPPPKKSAPLTPEQIKLMEVARKVATSVVALHAWDGYGNQLAEGCGFFIDENGAILTDLQLVNPEFAERIEYITVAIGTGAFHRITGYWAQDAKTGLTILQSDATETPFVMLRPDGDFSAEQPVSIVALSQANGLSLADAVIKADRTIPGEGWLNLRGEDSPGEPGSPVIDSEGRVVAVVSMRVPQGQWFNFGQPIINILPVLEQMAKSSPKPLAQLGRLARTSAKDDPRFLAAFQTLYSGQTVSGTSQLLLLLKTHPRSAELWALLSLAYAKLGAQEEALNCSRKAVALDPLIGKYWQQLATAQLSGGAAQPNPAAREALERTVEETPGDRIAWLLLAEQQILARQFAAAERSLLDVIKLESDYAPASFLLGYVKIQRTQYAEAEALLRRCVQLDKQHERAWFLLALLYARQQRLPEAAEAYRRLVAIQPAHPNAWRNLALVERKLGHTTAAYQAFQRHQQLGVPVR